MSVPGWKRSASKLDVFYEAVKLRHIVTQMIMRNFKLRTGNYKHLVSKRLREQYPELNKWFNKVEAYQQDVEETKELKKYDIWMINKVRSNLFAYSSELVEKIAKANEIKCNEGFEYIERIRLEDQAISAIAAIRQEVNFVEEFFEIDLNKYMNYQSNSKRLRTSYISGRGLHIRTICLGKRNKAQKIKCKYMGYVLMYTTNFCNANNNGNSNNNNASNEGSVRPIS